LTVAGKYAVDRQRLPRVWAKTGPVDPYLPLRGRYLSLQLEVASPPAAGNVELFVENGALRARPSTAQNGVIITGGARPVVAEPVACFIPEHAADLTRLRPGEELWVEVSVPRAGLPRPIRLGIKRDGVLTPVELR
jgi:hypothetical protein